MGRICFFITVLASLLFSSTSFGQNKYGIIDGQGDNDCYECWKIFKTMPKEVSYGVYIDNGNVYFTVSPASWFDKILPDNTYGVAADIVAKEQLTNCDGNAPINDNWQRGTLTEPVYKYHLSENVRDNGTGGVVVKLGPVPPKLIGKEKEANMVIVSMKKVCHYINFTHVDRNLWDLLDMGLFADSLITNENLPGKQNKNINLHYSKIASIEIPFKKGQSVYSEEDAKKLYQTMNLKGYRIKHVEIRSFSSVDGPRDANIKLQKERTNSILNTIQNFDTHPFTTNIITAENWVDFMQDVVKTPFAYLQGLSKHDIKLKFQKKSLLDSLEPMLAKERKAIIIAYLAPENYYDTIKEAQLLDSFNTSIKARNIEKSSKILRAVFEKISDHSITVDILNKIEIPAEKEFSILYASKQVYMSLLDMTSEEEALSELLKIDSLTPDNGKIKYNICALKMRLWNYNENYLDKDSFLTGIQSLTNFGINPVLINRMFINYYIMLCELYMKHENFDAKDKALEYIETEYVNKDLNDRDLLSLGKYFSAYGQYRWAQQILSDRMNKLDVNEDLLFFYLNVCIFLKENFDKADNKNILLNAISIDNARFCTFFNSINNGGITMQLLLNPFWKKMYCEDCN